MADRPALDRFELGASLLRQGTEELARLRRIRGAHTRTARRIRRALALVTLAASLLGVPLGATPASASTPSFARSTNPLGPFGTTNVGRYSAPAFGDLDGDGDLDALVGSKTGLHFLENSGTSRAPLFVSDVVDPFGITGAGTYNSPALVDIDGDGDLDVFAGNTTKVTFLLNTGTPTAPAFAAAVDGAFGLTGFAELSAPAFGDLDGDGDLDGLVGNFFGAVALFENTGTATAPAFTFAGNPPFGITSPGLRTRPALVDVDRDGDLDLFLGTDGGHTFFLRNSGTKTAPAFDAPVADAFGIGAVRYASAPAFADLDGDGELDAFVGSDAGTIPFFPNAGAFDVRFTSPFGLADVGADARPAFGDLDGDGDLDAVVGEFDSLFVLTNTGKKFDPAFAPPVALPFGLTDVSDYLAPALADIDGDGDLDLFVGEQAGGTLFFANTGTPTAPAFAAPVTSLIANVGAVSAPVFGDLDDDGDLDALVGENEGETFFVENTGTKTSPVFAAPVSPAFGLADVGRSSVPALVDLDGDGDLDVFVGNRAGDTVFFQNVGTPSAPAFAAPRTNPFRLANVGSYSAPTFADIHDNGSIDVFIGAGDGTIHFFPGTSHTGRVGFTAPEGVPEGTLGSGFHQPVLVDIDGDGDLDAFVGSSYYATRFFENVGSPTRASFAAPVPDAFGLGTPRAFAEVAQYDSRLAFVDIDGDGDLDAFFASFTSNFDNDTFFFANVGTRTAPAFAAPVANPFGISAPDLFALGTYDFPTFADLDGDGDFDALFGTNTGKVAFLANTGTKVAPAFAAPVADAFGLTGRGPNDITVLDFADVDRDGDLDAFVGGGDGMVAFQQNTGTKSAPSFAAPVLDAFGLVNVGSNVTAPAFGDLDADGDLDALVGSGSGVAFFPNVAPVPADFVGYQAKESDKKAAGGALAKGCRIELDEPLLSFRDGQPSGEDYDVTSVSALLLPGDTFGESLRALDENGVTRSPGMLAYKIKCAAKSALAVVNGKFQKCRKHVKRLGVELALLRPTFGGPSTLTVDTQKETRLLVPANADLSGGAVPSSPASAPPDRYKCYQVKPAKTGPFGTLQAGPGKLAPSLQLTVADALGEGHGHPLLGDARRYGIVKAAELCLPTAQTNIDPFEQDAKGQTRSTTCQVPGHGIQDRNVGMLCLQTSLAARAIAQPPVAGDKGAALDPKQTKHVARTLAGGNAVVVGHELGAPQAVDTKKDREVCVPVRVTHPGTTS